MAPQILIVEADGDLNQSMLAAKQTESKTSEANAKRAVPARSGHDVLQTNPTWQALALGPLSVQTKLTVSQPDDPYEREADQIADRVMRMTEPQADNFSNPIASIRPLAIQRKCGSCGPEQEELTAQRKCACGEIAEVSPKRKKQGGIEAQCFPSFQMLATLGAGQPLDPAARLFFEPRFGRDFGDVRVHTGVAAAGAAKSIGARAFTIGSNVVFGSDNFLPAGEDGRRLIAHELAHVAQSSATSDRSRIFRDPEPPTSGGEHPVSESPGHGIASPPTPEVELHPSSGRLLWFRGVPLAEDDAFVRQEMHRLIGDVGLEAADRWYRAAIGRPETTFDLPFSAHARAFGGLRPRSALDAQRDLEQEELRARYAPRVARIFPEVRAEAEAFRNNFENQARQQAFVVLRESEVRVNTERIRYGLEREEHQERSFRARGDREVATTVTTHSHRMRGTVSSEGLIGAARDLSAKQREIQTLLSARDRLVRVVSRHSVGREPLDHEEITDRPHYDELTTQARAKQREYDLMLALFQERYPILASFASDPAGIARLASAGVSPVAAGVLNERIYETLDNIATVRRELVPGGDVDIWKLPEIVYLTKVATGATPDTIVGRMRSRVVDDEARRITGELRLTSIALTVLAIGLALITAIPTGGGSLAVAGSALAAVAAAGLSFYQVAQDLREFQIEQAMTGTDLDRVRAISNEEPSLLWLAIDIIGAALDADSALRGTRQLLQIGQSTFRSLRAAARRAVTAVGADASEALATLRRAAEGHGGASLAARLEQTVQRIRRAGGSAERALAGAAGSEARAVERASANLTREAEEALAQAPTQLGGHTVKITRRGWLVRCTTCGELREEFAAELARSEDLAERLARIEERAVHAAGSGDRALADQAAQETRQLADELEALRRSQNPAAAVAEEGVIPLNELPTAIGTPPLNLRRAALGAGNMWASIDEPLENILVFLHGTELSSAQRIVSTQGRILSASGGNFRGRFFAAYEMADAELFAGRTTGRLGGRPSVVGIALSRRDYELLVRNRHILPGQEFTINSPAGEIIRQSRQVIFQPGSLQGLSRLGFFFLIL